MKLLGSLLDASWMPLEASCSPRIAIWSPRSPGIATMRFLGSPRIAIWSPRVTIMRPLGNMRIAIWSPGIATVRPLGSPRIAI